MKKIFLKVFTFIIALTLTFQVSAPSYAYRKTQHEQSDAKIVSRRLSIHQKIKVNKLKKEGFNVENNVYRVDGKDFIKFAKGDTTGLMNLNGRKFTTLTAVSTSYGARIIFEDYDGNRFFKDIDHTGKPIITTETKDLQSAMINFSGAYIGAIYGAAAGAIVGGPFGGLVGAITGIGYSVWFGEVVKP